LRKLPVSLALCALSAPALAQSSVTAYGILDVGIADITHSLNFDPNFLTGAPPIITGGTQNAVGMFNGALSASRWGLRGSEDLGGGLKAVFTLEEGFNMQSGAVSDAASALANNGLAGPDGSLDSAISGQIFNRGAFAGISSSTWGTLTAGRQQSFFLDNIAVFDPMQGSQAFSPIGFSGSYGGGGFTDDSRADGSVKYKINVANFTLGALYKFGGVAGASSSRSGEQLNAVYAAGPFAAQVGFEKFIDAFSLANPANTPTGSIAATAGDTTAYMVAAKYTCDPVTFRLGYEREEIADPSNPTIDATVTTLFNQTIASVNVTKFETDKNLNVYWAGLNWDMTPAFTLSVAGYHVAQDQYDSLSKGKTSVNPSGVLNYFSLVADYHVTKRTDTYAGVMDSIATGGSQTTIKAGGLVTTAYTVNSDRIVAIGARHMF
jgi:predicted porin